MGKIMKNGKQKKKTSLLGWIVILFCGYCLMQSVINEDNEKTQNTYQNESQVSNIQESITQENTAEVQTGSSEESAVENNGQNETTQSTEQSVSQTAKATDTMRSSDTSISNALYSMEEALGQPESEIYDYIGVPEREQYGVLYYTMDHLFEKTGTFTVEFLYSEIGRVTWIYTYDAMTQSSLDYSMQFYEDIVRVSEANWSTSGNTNTNGTTITYTCSTLTGNLTVERNIDTGVPQIKIMLEL